MNEDPNSEESQNSAPEPEGFILDLLELRFMGAADAPLERKKIADYIYQRLTTSTNEVSTPVPGTPFVEEGVAALMHELKNRAYNEGAFGAKAAAAVLRFLTPKDDDAAHVHGASISSLQMIARIAERLNLASD